MAQTTIRHGASRVVQGHFQVGRPIFRAAAGGFVCQPKMRGHGFEIPLHVKLTSSGVGQPLPLSVLQKMEQVFGTNFSAVRTHVGPEAAAIGAFAFTTGVDIYFAPGQYDPHSVHGQRLLGHELTHVVQQRSGRVRNPFGAGMAVVQDPGLEAEAERMGLRAAMTPSPKPPSQHPAAVRPPQIQRKAYGPILRKPEVAERGRLPKVVQLTKQEAIETASRMANYKYSKFQDVINDKYRFTEGQWREIVDDYNKNNKGVRLRFVYEKPPAQAAAPAGPRLNPSETAKLIKIKTELAKSPSHESFLYDLEMRVRAKLGMHGFVELYRGGHIILNDQGEAYKALVAKHKLLMKPRYTAKSQTSHYKASAGYDVSIEEATPQMGVDLPPPLEGHILFGIVPEKLGGKDPNSGNTFIQTEMFGFQNAYTTYIGHGLGFLANIAFGLQSGMVGTSTSSEKSGSAVVEK